jgi:hypothetical protein
MQTHSNFLLHGLPTLLDLLQILCFWTLSIVLFIFQNTMFRRLDSVSSSGKTYSVGSNRLS